MNPHDAFSATMAELWHEASKFTPEDFRLGIHTEMTLGQIRFRVFASFTHDGKHRLLQGPSFTMGESRDWENLTHRLREVTDRVRNEYPME